MSKSVLWSLWVLKWPFWACRQSGDLHMHSPVLSDKHLAGKMCRALNTDEHWPGLDRELTKYGYLRLKAFDLCWLLLDFFKLIATKAASWQVNDLGQSPAEKCGSKSKTQLAADERRHGWNGRREARHSELGKELGPCHRLKINVH